MKRGSSIGKLSDSEYSEETWRRARSGDEPEVSDMQGVEIWLGKGGGRRGRAHGGGGLGITNGGKGGWKEEDRSMQIPRGDSYV